MKRRTLPCRVRQPDKKGSYMAYDAYMMRATLSEVRAGFPDAKVEKVLQPKSDEIDLVIHSGRTSRRLILNVGAGTQRIQLSDIQRENPVKAPMLCMFLRKHLTGARLLSVTQEEGDRIATFTFSCYDDMGFPTEMRLIVEIMGKYANLIVTDSDMKILTAMKLVDFSDSEVRQILPGITYTLPEGQGKLSPLCATEEDFARALAAYPGGRRADKFFTSTFAGTASQIGMELACRATGAPDAPFSSADPARLLSVFLEWQRLLREEKYLPTIAFNAKGEPVDYSYMDITYRTDCRTEHYPDFSAMLDLWFSQRDMEEKRRQRAKDLIILLNNAVARTEKKLSLQRESLAECPMGEVYRKYGDLITANIYRIKRGDTSFTCTDYYDEGTPEVTVALDPRLSPAQNAQKMYRLYTKSKNAERVLTEQIAMWERELNYLDSVRDALGRAECEQDFAEIRDELYSSGYAARMKGYRPQKQIKPRPIELKTTDGMTLLVGRNNIQNDRLTFHTADKNDIWFHVKDIPGSHVILVTGGKEPTDRDYTEAACAAARYSKAEGDSVAVDYTRVRNVKKPSGSKPGFVIYKTNYTAFVNPDGAPTPREKEKM